MEEEQVQAIRETSRNLLYLNRRKLKDEEADVRRSMANLSISPAHITETVNNLKNKSSVSVQKLQALQNALVDDVKYIELVLNAHGALRGLVRELTGHDVSKQVAACGCLCNLALGDSRACCKVARAAGAYLVAAVDTLTTHLAVTCAWSLGNLAGSGPSACDLLAAQGAVAKLCDVTHHAEARDAAVYALTHFAYVMKDELSTEHLHKMLESLAETKITAESAQLLFILSCHKEFTSDLISEDYLETIMEAFTASSPRWRSAPEHKTQISTIVHLVRVLANMNNAKVYYILINHISTNNLVQDLKKLLEIEIVKNSLLWLLGNIYNCCGDSDIFHELLK